MSWGVLSFSTFIPTPAGRLPHRFLVEAFVSISMHKLVFIGEPKSSLPNVEESATTMPTIVCRLRAPLLPRLSMRFHRQRRSEVAPCRAGGTLLQSSLPFLGLTISSDPTLLAPYWGDARLTSAGDLYYLRAGLPSSFKMAQRRLFTSAPSNHVQNTMPGAACWLTGSLPSQGTAVRAIVFGKRTAGKMPVSESSFQYPQSITAYRKFRSIDMASENQNAASQYGRNAFGNPLPMYVVLHDASGAVRYTP